MPFIIGAKIRCAGRSHGEGEGRIRAPAKNMKRSFRGILILGLFLTLCLVAINAGAVYDPIKVTSSVDPKALTGPQSVNVTIRVVNTGEGEITDTITLYDPAGDRVASWDRLALNGSEVYNGSWSVTSDELSDGKMKYKLSYSVYDDDGNAQPSSKVVSVAISRASASAKLTGDYSVSPSVASKGQTVTFTYTLSNVGNVDIKEIYITNPNVTEATAAVELLAAGDKVTKTQSVVMGDKALSSKPRITYKAVGGDDKAVVLSLAEKTIELAESGLAVSLAVTGESEVTPGSTVELVLTVENAGNLTYTNLSVSEPSLGDFITGLDLKPGAKQVERRNLKVDESAEYTFIARGQDSTGQTVEVPSNTISVMAIDQSKILQMAVTASTDTTYITQTPEIAEFTITIKNTGDSEGSEIKVMHGETTIALVGTVDPGQTVTLVKNIEMSMQGTFQFTVVGKGEQGLETSVTTDPIVIAFMEPTPEPPPPTPTLVPATPEPSPTPEPEQGFGAGINWLYVIIALLVVLVILLVILMLIRRRNNKDGGGGDDGGVNPNSVDTVVMGTHRDYTGTKKPKKETRDGADEFATSPDEPPRYRHVDREVEYDAPDYGDDALPDERELARAQEEASQGRDVYESIYARPGTSSNTGRNYLDDDAGERPASRKKPQYSEEDDLDLPPVKKASKFSGGLRRDPSAILDSLEAKLEEDDRITAPEPDPDRSTESGRKRGRHQMPAEDAFVDAGDLPEPPRHAQAEAEDVIEGAGYRPLRQDTGHYRLPNKSVQGSTHEPEARETPGNESDASPQRAARRRRRSSEGTEGEK